jgi:hypothetical protein
MILYLHVHVYMHGFLSFPLHLSWYRCSLGVGGCGVEYSGGDTTMVGHPSSKRKKVQAPPSAGSNS